jgi:transcriptional regulator with XRE-family HTH domain
MKIIEFIKTKVQEEGSQTAVSRKTGVSQGTIAKILNGDTTPELETLKKIAAGYKVPLALFDELEITLHPHEIENLRRLTSHAVPAVREQQTDYPNNDLVAKYLALDDVSRFILDKTLEETAGMSEAELQKFFLDTLERAKKRGA